MFRPGHTDNCCRNNTDIDRTNCCYNPKAEIQMAESNAEYWKKEAEKWKARAESRGYKPDENRLDELEKRMNMAERWINQLIYKTRLID